MQLKSNAALRCGGLHSYTRCLYTHIIVFVPPTFPSVCVRVHVSTYVIKLCLCAIFRSTLHTKFVRLCLCGCVRCGCGVCALCARPSSGKLDRHIQLQPPKPAHPLEPSVPLLTRHGRFIIKTQSLTQQLCAVRRLSRIL